MVDYDATLLAELTDHVLLHLALPVNLQPPVRTTPAATQASTTYRWNVGTTTTAMQQGIAAWKLHSSTDEFGAALRKIVQDPTLSNDARSEQVEKFILESGVAAGVVEVSQKRAPINPNRWGKVLAPWFNDACRSSKK